MKLEIKYKKTDEKWNFFVGTVPVSFEPLYKKISWEENGLPQEQLLASQKLKVNLNGVETLFNHTSGILRVEF